MYDWSKDDSNISWAAFYSDVEHEVLEVTEGHRITLTYNLYDCDLRNDNNAPTLMPALEPTETSLYRFAMNIFQSPGFLRDGKLEQCQ